MLSLVSSQDVVETLDAGEMAEQSKDDEETKEKAVAPKSWEKNKKKRKGKPPPKKKTTNPKKAKKNTQSTVIATPEPEPVEEDKVESEPEVNEAADRSSDSESVKDDEEEWNRLQKNVKKQKELDQKPKDSHPVHAPYFPTVSVQCLHCVGSCSC